MWFSAVAGGPAASCGNSPERRILGLTPDLLKPKLEVILLPAQFENQGWMEGGVVAVAWRTRQGL